MESTLSVWPSSKRIAEELSVPIGIEIRPFDYEGDLTRISVQDISRCPQCQAFVTKIFVQADKTCVCPFCSTVVESYHHVQTAFRDFRVESPKHDAKVIICFILDLCCSKEYLDFAKTNLKLALRNITSGMPFLLCFRKQKCVSFLKLGENMPVYFDFPVNRVILGSLDLESMQNCDCSQEELDKMIDETQIQAEGTDLSLSSMFKGCNMDTSYHFIVFSPKQPHNINCRNIVVDWINPLQKVSAERSDGFTITNRDMEDFSWQILSLVQRLSTDRRAIFVDIRIYAPPEFEMTQNTLNYPVLWCGASRYVNISLPKATVAYNSIPIQIACNYVVVGSCEAYNRTAVFSRVFPVSKSYLPILRAINPIVMQKALIIEGSEGSFLSKLSDVYKSKVVDILPGESKGDLFFNLLPELRWFIRFYWYRARSRSTTLILPKAYSLTQYFPLICVWDSPDGIAEDATLMRLPDLLVYPIIVIDCSKTICVFTDKEDISPNSKLAESISHRVSSRYPVPSVSYYPKSTVVQYAPDEEQIYNDITKKVPAQPISMPIDRIMNFMKI